MTVKGLISRVHNVVAMSVKRKAAALRRFQIRGIAGAALAEPGVVKDGTERLVQFFRRSATTRD